MTPFVFAVSKFAPLLKMKLVAVVPPGPDMIEFADPAGKVIVPLILNVNALFLKNLTLPVPFIVKE